MSNPVNVADFPSGMSKQSLANFPVSLVLADPHREDCPVVFANRAFTRLTGYSEAAVLGRNCRFLQGEETREEDRRTIREALREVREVTVDIANYRADGSKFMNRLVVTPLHAPDGELLYFLGLQVERGVLTADEQRIAELDERLRELQHRVKNHLGMILGLIRIQARSDDPKEIVDVLSRRVRSISLLYDEFWDNMQRKAGDTIDAGAYISRVASALHELDGRPDVRLNIDVTAMAMSIDDAGRLGLAVSEIITNAFQHGFRERESGEIRVALTERDGRRVVTVTDDGRGIPPGRWPGRDSLGSRIVTELVARISGELSVRPRPEGGGTQISIVF